jgi:sulfoxide reductase heme-binding subunit YedZ
MARPAVKFTRLQIFTHAAAWVPLLLLVWDAYRGNLSVNPYQAATQRTGDFALILLLLSLACTPVNTLFRLPQVLRLRRPLGLYAFMYAAVHLFIFTGLDYGFNWDLLVKDLSDKRYIFVGLAAFLILIPLAVTSRNWWKVRLGKNWKRLHRLVYLAAGLVVLHFAWVIKGDVAQLQGDVLRPLLAGGVLALLLVARIPPVRKRLSGAGQHLLPGRGRPRKPLRPAATASTNREELS